MVYILNNNFRKYGIKMEEILLVEDDLSIIDGLVYSLEKNNFHVDVARTIHKALQQYNKKEYSLLLLDVTLPDGLGFSICEKVRLISTVPIIFLTASDEEVNVVKGLDIGADDYITKPFKLTELISRIGALIRRANNFEVKTIQELSSNGIIIKLLENKATKNNITLDLSPNEYCLLCMLMRNPGIVLSRDTILNKLWDDKGNFIDDNTLSVYVSRLRKKIENDPDNPKFLLTVRGIGYRWSIL